MIPLVQHPRFAQALAATGRPPRILPGGLVVLERRTCGVRFNLATRARLSPEGMAALRRLPGLTLVNPDCPAPELAAAGALPLFTPAAVALLDLAPDMAARRAAQHPNWRAALRRAEGSGLRVTCGTMPDTPAHWLYRADRAQQAARGYRTWPIALTRAYVAGGRNRAVLFTASDAAGPVAAMLFLRHGDGASYHIGQSSPEGRRLCAHHLLLHQAAGWLAARGHTAIDLGRADGGTPPGLARFKLRSGAKPHPLGGTWIFGVPARAFRPLVRRDCTAMGASGV